MDWQSTRLDNHHQLDQFDCGEPSLNDWLIGQAHRAQQAGAARTWVWTAAGDIRVVAYFSTCPTRVERAEVSAAMAGGYSIIPAYLLARLTLDRTLRGQNLGGDLLLDALERIVDAAGVAGGRLIVVDAINERAARFYARHDFQPVKNTPGRLVLKVATAVKALGRG